MTTMSGINYLGLWWQLDLPYPIILSNYTIQALGDLCKTPTAWVVGGYSQETSTWTLIDDKSTQSNWATGGQILSRTTSNVNPFSSFRLVVLTCGNTTCGLSVRDIPGIAELRFFGKRPLPFTRYSLGLEVVDTKL